MAVWRLQVNTGGTNVADYCLKNHVAAMGWSLRELTQAERSGIHTFLDYCNLARTQYKSFDSVCRMVEDVKEGDLRCAQEMKESTILRELRRTVLGCFARMQYRLMQQIS